MKLKIKENSISYDELKQTLTQEFGDLYKIDDYSKSIISVSKTKLIGANVAVFKNKILINGGFPSMAYNIGFMLFIILLGFIIPLIIYLLVLHKKMKAVEKEVADFIKVTYKDKIMM